MINASRTTDKQLWDWALKNGIPIRAICFKDQLQSLVPAPGGYIINMADSNDGSNGTHWVALWIDGSRMGAAKSRSRVAKAFYFDSFGVDMPTAVSQFINRAGMPTAVHSTKEIQNINGGGCGQYCMLFLHQMSKQPRLKPEQRYANFLKMFSSQSFHS